MPGGTTLFTVAPHPGCVPELTAKLGGPIMLLDAVRHGARLGDIGLGRSPSWFNCETIVADALELPLLPHEARAFIGAPIEASLRPVLLGPGAVCRRNVAADVAVPSVVVCGKDVADIPGDVVPDGPAPSPVALPFEAGRGELAQLLGFGWRPGLGGGAWSEGPHSTILLGVPTGRPLELRLRASGVAFRPGEPRTVRVTAGRLPVGQFSLPDGLVTEVAVAIPASTIASGMLRVAFDVVRPVDPARRGIVAPVQRAAIQLSSVSLRFE